MGLHKTIEYERQDDKETKGCYRYAASKGDAGITTLYLRKESVDGKPPKRLKATITEAD